MLRSLVRFSIQYRHAVVVAALILTAYGIYRFLNAGLDIFPEFAPKLVVIQTEAPGLTAEQVELRVTRPLEAVLGGLVDLDYVGSESIQGLSVITVVFDEYSNTYRNRALVGERLNAAAALPAGVGKPVIAPLSSSSATVRTIGLSAIGEQAPDLRAIAETVVVPRVLGVRGVADVNVFGGRQRAIQITPDPVALTQHGLALAELKQSIRGVLSAPAMGVVNSGQQALGISLADNSLSPQDLGLSSVRYAAHGTTSLNDVARVQWGALPRISAAQIGGKEAVVMMIIGQLGANTQTVSEQLEGALGELQPVLAQQGVYLHGELFVPANYINRALHEISSHLLIGGSLVLLVLLIGLYNVRTALISAFAIPLSLLSAVIVLSAFGVNLNILVIGGLAIALGEVVDDAIIDTENIFRRLRTAPQGTSMAAVALEASLEVRGAVVYATLIVALVFLPLLTLGGVTGRLFAPLGVAYILAVLASLAVAIIVTPALCVLFLSRLHDNQQSSPVFRLITPAYAAAVRFFAERNWLSVGLSLGCLIAVMLMAPSLGVRFLPELREGHYIVHTTALPGTSLDETIRIGKNLTQAFSEIDGVVSTSQWAGRAERGADTFGSHYSEYDVALAPMSGPAQREVLQSLRNILANYPGITYEANTFLAERIGETISGYSAPVVVNIFGPDLEELDRKAQQIAAIIRQLPGAREVAIRASHTTPTVQIDINREKLRWFGLSHSDVTAALEVISGGHVLAEGFDGHLRIPVVMTAPPAWRGDLNALRQLPVAEREEYPIRLEDVAAISQGSGRYNILHRDGQRLQVVTSFVDSADIGQFMRMLRAKVFAQIKFDDGTHIEISGAAVEQASARERLLVHAVMATFGVLLLVLVAVGHFRHLVLILFNLPFSLLGGLIVVIAGGGVLSIGQLVGFVTLFGITVRNSIMLVSHYNHLVINEKAPWQLDTVVRGAAERLPAIGMTALVTALAMLPLTINSDNPGREIMGPMAAIIVGGLVSSTLLNLLVMPALLHRYGEFSAEDAIE